MTRSPAIPFRYEGYDLDADAGRLVCRYSLGPHRFAEAAVVTGTGGPRAPVEVLDACARIVYLLAGVSYYKTAAPPVVDLGDTETTPAERAFLRTFYVEGLGEFAHRNGLDLSELEVTGPDRAPAPPLAWSPDPGRPLVPFGGGIDSIVTVESVRAAHPGAALFIVSRASDRFEALEDAAALTGLDALRAQRSLDPAVLHSAEHGFLNGHVPVTGIVSALAVLAAAVDDRGAVVMSNEWSASSGTDLGGGKMVNHQWSKSLGFEAAFRALLGATFAPGTDYFSFLRSRSELWVAERFGALPAYHRVFRSCNRAFHQDPGRRLDRWCAECDKCCFIDLVLSPFLAPVDLATIFDGREPLTNEALAGRFCDLLGIGEGTKPFECVGDVGECRAALFAAAARPDRADHALVHRLADALPVATPARSGPGPLLGRLGTDFVPAGYRDGASR